MKLALFQPKPAFYVAIGVIALYSICLTFGFFWDDSVIIVKNAVIKNIQYIPDFFSLRYWQFFDPGSPGHYRPMRLLGFSMLHALFGPEPIVYHAWNLFLYCILSIFLLRFGTAIGLSPMASLAATVLFVVHPLHVEVVAWAKNSSELLATLFIILSWIYLLKYMNADLKVDQTKKRIFLMISLLLYSFSLMSKEIGVVFPVLLSVFIVLYKSELNLTEKIRIVLPYVLVSLCMVFFILLFLHPGMPGNPMVKQFPLEKSILLVPLTITVYIKLLCFPYPLNIDRSLDGPFSLDLMNFFIPLAFLVTLTIFHLFLAKKNKTLTFFSSG